METNKPLIKERCEAFVEWDKRNPVEKRREKLVDHEADPVPAQEFFSVPVSAIKYIIDNF